MDVALTLRVNHYKSVCAIFFSVLRIIIRFLTGRIETSILTSIKSIDVSIAILDDCLINFLMLHETAHLMIDFLRFTQNSREESEINAA